MKTSPEVKRGFYLFLPIVIIITLIILFLVYKFPSFDNKDSLGKVAVMDMYNFDDLYQLQAQDEDLKTICDDESYNRLTATNVSNSLNKFLRFKNESCKVNVIRESDGSVLYSLDTPYIASDRYFIFLYDVTDDDKITNAREMMCIDFPTEGSSNSIESSDVPWFLM